MQKILVIVDMQIGFKSAKHLATTDAIVERIEAAKSETIPIIVLELENPANKKGFGPTVPKIMTAIKGYKQAYVIKKIFNDGSWFIKRKLIELGMKVDAEYTFIVTGINTEACVCETCDGLLLEFKNKTTTVIVPRNSTNGDTHHPELERFEEMRFITTMDERLKYDPPFEKDFEEEYGSFEFMTVGIEANNDHSMHMFTNKKLETIGPDAVLKELLATKAKQDEEMKPKHHKNKAA